MKHFFKGLINLKGDLYESIIKEENSENRSIANECKELIFENGFKLKLSISGFKGYRKNNIYVPINIIYNLRLLDSSDNVVKEKEFKINDISRLLNYFSIVYDEIIYVIKIGTLSADSLKNTNEFNEESLEVFVKNTKLTIDEIFNMCYIVLKNLECIKNAEFKNFIVNKIEESNLCSNNRENFKFTIASLLGNLVKKELTTNNHTENMDDIIEFYYQRYFNSVA